MSLEQGSWGRTALLALQTLGTVAATVYGGPWAGLAATAFHTAFWAWYDTSNAQDVRTEQESLADLTVQGSAFGGAIPQVWGRYGGISGNVIWATDKVEHIHTDRKSGGKGGGPKQITVTKTYSMSMALGICDTRLSGPMTRIVRIFRDLKLIADINQQGGGAIATFSINSAGSGYAVNDIGGVGEGDLNAAYRVATVNGSGGITELELTNPGTGYAVNQHVALHRGSGSGNNAFIDITSIIGNTIPTNFTFYPGTADQLPDPTMEAALGVGNVPAYRHLCYVVIKDEDLGPGGRTFQYSFDLEQDPAPSLATVVADLCEPVGIPSTSLVLDDLPAGQVNMALVSVQAARAPLQFLAQAYRFYIVESGRALAFREIGAGAVIATVPEADIDAGEEVSQGIGLVIARNDDIQLPTEINVSYTDPQQNYQQNVQRAALSLVAGGTEDPRVIALPLALSAAQAKQVAQEELYMRYTERDGIQTTLGRKYAYLEPGDRIQITGRTLTYPAMVRTTAYGRPGLLELTAATDASFVRGAVGGPPGVVIPPTQPLPEVRVTTAYLLNLPALGASDVPARYHVGFAGHGTDFPGAALYRSVDGGASYQEVHASALEASVGTVATATPSPPAAHVFDDTTVITVVMFNDRMQLASVADGALFAGQNLAVLGEELLSFGTATLVGPRTYQLTHLLRGRRGTDQATATHEAAEDFVVLNTAVAPVLMPISDRDIQRQFKAVTVGQSIANVVEVDFTPTAANAFPWAAANVEATRDAADAWQLTWTYQPRLGGDWVTGLSAGFDSDFAGFRVVIYSDNSYAVPVRSTVTDGGTPLSATATKAFTYPASLQVADFAAVQDILHYRVFQMSQPGDGPAADQMAIAGPGAVVLQGNFTLTGVITLSWTDAVVYEEETPTYRIYFSPNETNTYTLYDSDTGSPYVTTVGELFVGYFAVRAETPIGGLGPLSNAVATNWQ